ncbi:multiple epidermal growth factor-like domains protein 10 [Apis florea]|uniref:multiple epidermal growth factor-like domains protein 10 n=1 Tax=Apis florea TaxID=7463 RepID=UPI0012FE8E11|nr:multiple epidermal growth factor-like domains protein 10 [Apis florea]
MRCLGCFVFLNLVTTALCLIGEEGSVCNVHVSRMESRYVPYTETYKVRWGFFYQTKTRTNYRIDHFPLWTFQQICCDGYEDRSGVCVPVCSPECVNGKCTKPNVCECDVGYWSLYTQHACEPLCATNCTNGFCSRPNRCSCNAGYQLDEDELHCLPVCAQDCANSNAHCTEPNRCTCNSGYRQSGTDAAACTPICEIPCVNGECIEPNVCACNHGYSIEGDIDRFACKPKCDRICLNGKCTAPNVCTCDPGYRLNENGECEPNCGEPCVMGICIAPDVCSCYPGYGLPDDSRYVCEAVCEKGCANGTCTAPDVCTCHHGYRATGDDTTRHVCEPVCEPPCEPSGHCAAPNTCDCFQGYRMIDTRENEVSLTDLFFFFFVLDNTTIVSACEPVCEQNCVNATCTEPNVCTCDHGFAKDANDRCEPVCSFCRNGSCVAPNVCQCWQGFVPAEEHGCAPYCENGCENGECVAPNECTCHEGFESSGNKSRCVERVPVCTQPCKGHSVCVEDEKPCQCSYGWTGLECDQPTLCILLMNSDDENLVGVAIRNETNNTLTDAKLHAPLCYPCNNGTTSNESYCFVIDDSSIGCFVETVDSSCYGGKTDAAKFKMQAGMLGAVVVLILAIVTIACFTIYRHRREKIRSAIAQNVLQEGMANEYLISERDDHSASSIDFYER